MGQKYLIKLNFQCGGNHARADEDSDQKLNPNNHNRILPGVRARRGKRVWGGGEFGIWGHGRRGARSRQGRGGEGGSTAMQSQITRTQIAVSFLWMQECRAASKGKQSKTIHPPPACGPRGSRVRGGDWTRGR